MKTYKGIYVSPEFHAEFKVFSAKQRETMGELVEKIITNHMREKETRENKEENK